MTEYPTLETRIKFENGLRERFIKSHNTPNSKVKLFSDLHVADASTMISKAQLSDDERALFVYFSDPSDWLLITSEKVVWCFADLTKALNLSDIRTCSTGSREQLLHSRNLKDFAEKQAARELYKTINLIEESGAVHNVEVEVGSGCRALNEALSLLHANEKMRRKWTKDPDAHRAHASTSWHRADLERSDNCGCFYCLASFSPSEIEEWIDRDRSGVGQTALCPRCGIDSILAAASGWPLTPEFLQRMNAMWFGDPITICS